MNNDIVENDENVVEKHVHFDMRTRDLMRYRRYSGVYQVHQSMFMMFECHFFDNTVVNRILHAKNKGYDLFVSIYNAFHDRINVHQRIDLFTQSNDGERIICLSSKNIYDLEAHIGCIFDNCRVVLYVLPL